MATASSGAHKHGHDGILLGRRAPRCRNRRRHRLVGVGHLGGGAKPLLYLATMLDSTWNESAAPDRHGVHVYTLRPPLLTTTKLDTCFTTTKRTTTLATKRT